MNIHIHMWNNLKKIISESIHEVWSRDELLALIEELEERET